MKPSFLELNWFVSNRNRQGEWTDGIAVGSKAFLEKVKSLLTFKAKGREILNGAQCNL
ncbi:hypothetical protein DESC_910060 [Desulfosarcina cetonica]|nr:hypothetical protein DESC_910060 [Desulfosarcina cetonica]